MELFDKKFVRFMWDDELEGKVCFAADNMEALIFAVENDGKCAVKTNALRYNGNDVRPFHAYVLGANCSYPFAYYDENYSIKKAFNEGEKIQYQLVSGVDWRDVDGEDAFERCLEDGRVFRVKPECLCEDGIDSKDCVGCEHSEDGIDFKACVGCPQDEARKQTFRPFKDCDELVEFWAKNYQTGFRPAHTMPLIWLRRKNEEQRSFVTDFIGGRVRIEDAEYTMAALLDIWTFLDGGPVGMEVKE